MATAAALTLIDGIARDRVVHDVSVRTQVALLRALIDEIERRERSNASLAALWDQLDEETHRLTKMLREAPSAPPPSGVQLRTSFARSVSGGGDEHDRPARS